LAGNSKGEWSLLPILNAIRKLPGVKSANGIRNNTMNIDSFGLSPKSIWIVVDGGIKEEIAHAIYMHIHTPDTKGNVVVNVPTSVPDHFETIRFDRPAQADIEYKLDIKSADELKIKNLIDDYINEAGIGALLSNGTFLYEYLYNKNYKYTDFDLKFRKKNTLIWSNSIQLNFNEIPKSAGRIS